MRVPRAVKSLLTETTYLEFIKRNWEDRYGAICWARGYAEATYGELKAEGLDRLTFEITKLALESEEAESFWTAFLAFIQEHRSRFSVYRLTAHAA